MNNEISPIRVPVQESYMSLPKHDRVNYLENENLLITVNDILEPDLIDSTIQMQERGFPVLSIAHIAASAIYNSRAENIEIPTYDPRIHARHGKERAI